MNIIDMPNGQSGDWKIEDFEVSKDEAKFFNMRAMFKPGSRGIRPGKYKRLKRNGTIVMSNTPSELRDHRYFVYKAKGNVLINGLGLGCVLSEIVAKDNVESITVIEISEDVINLVAPFFQNPPRVNIIHADAFTWKPPKGVRYDAVWHDIWDFICTDNLKEMEKLHRKYGRRCDYQDSWCKALCKRYK
jgi:Spermine/spermidine synthase domain